MSKVDQLSLTNGNPKMRNVNRTTGGVLRLRLGCLDATHPSAFSAASLTYTRSLKQQKGMRLRRANDFRRISARMTSVTGC